MRWSRHEERIYILAKLSRDRRKLLWMSAYPLSHKSDPREEIAPRRGASPLALRL